MCRVGGPGLDQLHNEYLGIALGYVGCSIEQERRLTNSEGNPKGHRLQAFKGCLWAGV